KAQRRHAAVDHEHSDGSLKLETVVAAAV
ncbi:hypothetical protein PC128_g26534, partial [Phytophthora cactorum]